MSFGNVGTDNGTFNMSCPSSTGGDITFRSRGTVGPAAIAITAGTAPFPFVSLADTDISTDSRRLRINAGAFTTAADDLGTGNFDTETLRLGGGSTGASFRGKISEFIIWQNNSMAGTTSLDTNLMTFWGIS
jgi:hypothetical protein